MFLLCVLPFSPSACPQHCKLLKSECERMRSECEKKPPKTSKPTDSKKTNKKEQLSQPQFSIHVYHKHIVRLLHSSKQSVVKAEVKCSARSGGGGFWFSVLEKAQPPPPQPNSIPYISSQTNTFYMDSIYFYIIIENMVCCWMDHISAKCSLGQGNVPDGSLDRHTHTHTQR